MTATVMQGTNSTQVLKTNFYKENEEMKRMIPMAAMAVLLTNWNGSQAMAAEATAAVDINSAYVWRGLTFNDGIVVQPSMEVTSGGFTFNVWGNVDVDDYDDTLETGDFSEVDLAASYTYSIGSVEASVGVIEYLFPAGGASTTEIFASAGMDIGAGFSTGVELYYDFDQVDDFYAVLSVGYAYDFSDKLGMELGVSASYAGEDFAMTYAEGTEAGLFNYNLSASLSYAVTEEFGVGLSLNYSDSLDDDVLPDEAVDAKFYGGLSLSYSF